MAFVGVQAMPLGMVPQPFSARAHIDPMQMAGPSGVQVRAFPATATPRSPPVVLPEVRTYQAVEPQALLQQVPYRFIVEPGPVAPEAPLFLGKLQEQGIEEPDDFKPKVSLPPEAVRENWSLFEKDLYLQTDGVYHPGKMAHRRRLPTGRSPFPMSGTGVSEQVRGRVSVVSPTMSSRQHFHEQLWGCFEAQAWPDKELIVVETYVESPSAFLHQKAKEDRRLVHVSFKVDPEQDFTVGLKRDMTLHLASGEFVANFDDDDVYAATYLVKMVTHLVEQDLAALTLSHWFNYFVRSSTCGYSDRECWGAADQEELEEVLYGYGFSYVHRRREALAMPYPNVEFAEDAPFMLTLRQELGDDKVGLKRDEEGICMHIIHRANSTGDPEFAPRKVAPSELLGLEVASLPLFKRYLDAQSPMCWPASLPPIPFSVWPWNPSPSTSPSKHMHVSCM